MTRRCCPSRAAAFRAIGCCRSTSRSPSASCSSSCAICAACGARVRWRGDRDLSRAWSRAQPALENALDASQFRLYCTPAVNLFPRATDRVHVTSARDRTSPGAGSQSADGLRDLSLEQSAGHRRRRRIDHAKCCRSIRRVIAPTRGQPHRVLHPAAAAAAVSARQQQTGARSGYIGSECFMSIVDSRSGSSPASIRQLEAQALCTNRDLPISSRSGRARRTSLVDGGAPVESVRCICRAELSAPIAGVRRQRRGSSSAICR